MRLDVPIADRDAVQDDVARSDAARGNLEVAMRNPPLGIAGSMLPDRIGTTRSGWWDAISNRRSCRR
jgi:hypothetical protein